MLSRRERTVAELYASGKSHKEIARELDVSPSTVRNHIAAIYRKLGINNKARLVNQLAEMSDNPYSCRPFARDTLASAALCQLDQLPPASLAHPSIAVLPFTNLGRPERVHISQGIGLNVHNNLTRFPDLFVSGRSSCLAVDHLATDAVEVAHNLGVRYLVRGAVRSEERRVLVTAELLDASNGGVLWSEQFDGVSNDVMMLETEIANAIAGQLSVRIETAQYERCKSLQDHELAAYDWQVRGYRSLELGGPENLRGAIREFGESLKLDPDSAAAHAGLSMAYGYECDQLLADDYARALDEHSRLAQKAVELDESDSRAHYAMLCAWSLRGEFELADQHARRAVELNPSEYHNLCSRGYTLMALDDFSHSVDCFTESLRRNPLAPNSCLLALGLMEYLSGHFDQSAVAFFRMSPTYLQKQSSMAAAFGQLGQDDDADQAARVFREEARQRPGYPGSSDENWHRFWSRLYPHLGEEGFARFVEGLSKAGFQVEQA